MEGKIIQIAVGSSEMDGHTLYGLSDQGIVYEWRTWYEHKGQHEVIRKAWVPLKVLAGEEPA